ncbi:MAG: hypothetical protein ACI90V_011863 [Bacillariaceae sp.]|jgi:hypothetical protein
MIMNNSNTVIFSVSILNPTSFYVPDVPMMSLCVCVRVYSGLTVGEFSSIVLDWQYGHLEDCVFFYFLP